MSLAAQSQMWFPTNVQVTVLQARGLRVKGKNGTNDTYVIIQVAKDKFSTSVAEKSVSPVWKEEASFGLPLFHSSNAERCTLYITAMHRAHVGLDKFLGQAVINLLELFDNKSRKKTDWFKLVDKAGKDDKPRGEVLLDIQFMRNNMSASMFDLSMQDKRRSHISKLKDKVRRKKKDGFTDSASAIVSPVSQIFTDSEGETDTQSLSQSSGVKKKSKLKTLFAPKSNLQRNISQSLSTLRAHPEKSSDLTSNHSSDLSVDSPEVKKTFKLLGHKRTASSDSKTSQGPVSLLGCSKQSNSDLNNLCINGSHLFIEDTKSGSTVSLNSIGQDSVEDVLKHNRHASCVRSDKMILEQQCHLQQEEKSEGEKRCIAEAKRLEEEEKCKLEASRLKEEKENRSREEGEKKRCISEDETQRKKWREEEEKIRKLAEECKMSDLAENPRLEEECHREEEQRQQEEISMSERLTSLFGIVRKKKEELQQDIKDEPPTQAPKADIGHQDRSAMVFLNRTAKVSAVKPRTISDSHQQVIMEEPMEYQSENGSSGKMPLRAWVSPSEVQPVSAQNSSGSGLMIFPRRSHPVKPMNSQTESQHPLSTPAVKEIRVQDSTPGKIQMTDSESQPYTQLTQEELITLVVKQQSDLSRKDAKIIQLEEYIDNLLVRVIEEKPSILQCLQALK
ncbi:rab11 family-interacting protein 1 isoform X6 [Takifugu rubripes]|uniref:rab11 family-interacting protein 1 isoform X6 n=1 Tax=Takifugu rubripes TaxID=31033 RepID=UPI001145F333|nr:rab11 family-interacting protein 1-like isoform X6 [Takifugu rubripes]